MKELNLCYVDVKACARCKQDHDALTFRPLLNASDQWDWWALCPTNGQPILMRVEEE